MAWAGSELGDGILRFKRAGAYAVEQPFDGCAVEAGDFLQCARVGSLRQPIDVAMQSRLGYSPRLGCAIHVSREVSFDQRYKSIRQFHRAPFVTQ